MRSGTNIVFSQAGQLALLDTRDDSIRRLNVRLASDRVAARQRYEAAAETITGYSLSHDGSALLLETRGELLAIDLETDAVRSLTNSSAAREWGAAFLGEDRVAFITDQPGEQQIGVVQSDGTGKPSQATEDRAAWLMPVVTSADGNWIAFGDAELRLHALDLRTLDRFVVDISEADEIVDYRFSPDCKWLAYTKQMTNDFSMVHICSLETRRTFPVSTGMQRDGEPRWDPAGEYLYFLSNRHLDPVLDEFDYDHAYVKTTRICAVSLHADVPPPTKDAARAVGFDLESWAGATDEIEELDVLEELDEAEVEELLRARMEAENDEGALDEGELPPVLQVDTDGLASRQYLLPIEPGFYAQLEAVGGGVVYLSMPVTGLRADDWATPGMGDAEAKLYHYDCASEETTELATDIGDYAISLDEQVIVVRTAEGLAKLEGPDEEPTPIDLSEARVRIDAAQEWQQIFNESWRLQRDFYWAPNMVGVDWAAMRDKYAVLLPRIGSREELSDLISQMIGELGTSHAYNWGGDSHDEAKPVNVGLLGADIEFDGRGFLIANVLPSLPLEDELISPLGQPFLGEVQGKYLLAMNGKKLASSDNVYDFLQDLAGKEVTLEIGDATGGNSRTFTVRAIEDESGLRYQAWVARNRDYVAKSSEGQIGYMHLPDMDTDGLIAFARQYYPQLDKKGLIIDVRNNGGGFVSQMLVQRLARRIWAYGSARHGVRLETYPARALSAHMATLIDEHAGSDGDIFPASFRKLGLGPLIGTRTWGGVIGIRADKPFIDFGLSTQPEFAWWDDQGWSIENEGVWPDIEVEILPEDRIAGRDPQLDRAIEVIRKKIQESPIVVPAPPPYPNRAAGQ
jgi:tricorn protease